MNILARIAQAWRSRRARAAEQRARDIADGKYCVVGTPGCAGDCHDCYLDNASAP